MIRETIKYLNMLHLKPYSIVASSLTISITILLKSIIFTGPKTKILATGGASVNKSILQVIADVFNAPVYTQVRTIYYLSSVVLSYIISVQEEANSAVMGAAYQAKFGLRGKDQSYTSMTAHLPAPKLTCVPYKDVNQIYRPMMERYRKIIETLTKNA